MEPAHDITQKMEGLTIKPKARAVTPYTTTMESTHEISQEMEEMALDPQPRAGTPSTVTDSSCTGSVFRQQQPSSAANTTGGYKYTTTSTGLSFLNPDASSSRSSPPAPFMFAAGPTEGYAYATSPTGLTFSNPNAGSSNTTTTSTSTNQSETQDLINHLLKCDDPVGFYKFSLYHSSLDHSHSHTHPHPHTANNRITKSRSSPTLRKRYHQARQQIPTPFPSTTIYEAKIERVPGTKTIYTTTEEEEKEEEKDRMTMAFFQLSLQRTKARVATEKTAKAARQRQKQSESGMGACGEAWFQTSPMVPEKLEAWRTEVRMPRAKIIYVNGNGDFVEESWEKTTPPKWSWEEESDGGVDAMDEEVCDEEDEMME